MDNEKAYSEIVSSTRAYFKKAGFSRAVIGLSGGIDSSLAAYVLVDALGKGNVTALLMPDACVNNSEDHSDAAAVAKRLGIDYKEVPINSLIEAVGKSVKWRQSRLAGMNARARLRMVLLYDFANSLHALVVGTSNKSELMLGYFTKHGDGAADFLPFAKLFKIEVRQLARLRGLPKRIIEKEPSPGLLAGQTDAKELGAGYEEIDPILKEIEKGKAKKQLKEKFEAELVDNLLERMKQNRHKLRSPGD